MFAKLLVVCALAVAANAEVVAVSAEYPPGVHPALCPNYPYCDMSLMARYKMDGVIPEWVMNPYIMPYGRMAPFAPLLKPVVTPEPVPAAKFPADFDSAKCPNYPYCEEQ